MPDRGASPIRLLPAARAAILRAAAAAAPREGCGVLVGRAASDAAPSVIVAAPATTNTAAAADRFHIAPAAIAAAAHAARTQGLEVVGFYHSHPRGPAAPSPADIAEASAWPGYLHVIAAVNDPAGLRAWRTGTIHWHEQSIDGGTTWPAS